MKEKFKQNPLVYGIVVLITSLLLTAGMSYALVSPAQSETVDTVITAGPVNPTKDFTANFNFTASPADSRFECKLDNLAYVACTTPMSYNGLSVGQHSFSVRAISADIVDATPAVHNWMIEAAKPLYMVGDSITQQSTAELTTAFNNVGRTSTYLNSASGRAITRQGLSASGVRSSGFEAIQTDADRIKNSDTIIVELGTNPELAYNNWSTFEANAGQLIERIKSQNPNAKIYWVNVFATGEHPFTNPRIAIPKNAINDIIARLSSSQGFTVIDVSNAGIQLNADNIHPTPEGRVTFAKSVADGLGVIAVGSVSPSVNITSPTLNAVLSGSSSAISANATDDTAVVGVQFKVDGANIGSEDTTAPYAITWNTLSVPNGTHTLTAVARDQAGNSTTSSPITITIQNAGAASAYSDKIMKTAGLLSYWRLGDPFGSLAAFDQKGARNGSYQNGSVLGVSGVLTNDSNTAVKFDGINDSVSLPALPTSVNFTVEGWQKLDASATGNNTLYGGSATLRLMPRTTGYYAGVYLGGKEYLLQGTTAQNTGTWVHWAVVRSGVSLAIYRNGVLAASRTGLPASTVASLSGHIGRSVTAYPTKGIIDEVAVYNSALTASDIMSHYNSR